MIGDIKVYTKETNKETVFITKYDNKNYLYRASQITELVKCDKNHLNCQFSVIAVLTLMSCVNMFSALQETTFNLLMKSIIERTASDGLLLSIPLNLLVMVAFSIMLPVYIFLIRDFNRKLKFIKDESDGMIEKLNEIPIDMTNKTS